MSRPIWKGINTINAFKEQKQDTSKKYHVISWKNTGIPVLPEMLGKTVNVYTGRVFRRIIIQEDMIGKRLGNLISTIQLKRVGRKKKRKR